MKRILVVVCLTALAAGAQEYRPLTRGQKKDFRRAARALFSALEEENYQAVRDFGPGILSEYRGIRLDPACGGLRPVYESVDSLVGVIESVLTVDSLTRATTEAFKAQDYKRCIELYEPFYDYLRSAGNDSLIQLHTRRIRTCAREFFATDTAQDLQKYRWLARKELPLEHFLGELRRDIEESHQAMLMSLSATLNLDSIIVFRNDYPGLFQRDVQSLYEKAAAKYRLSVMRHPGKEAIEEYRRRFPGKDAVMDDLYEEAVANEYFDTGDINKGAAYLRMFPEGRYAYRIRRQIQAALEVERALQEQGDSVGQDLGYGGMSNGHQSW